MTSGKEKEKERVEQAAKRLLQWGPIEREKESLPNDDRACV